MDVVQRGVEGSPETRRLPAEGPGSRLQPAWLLLATVASGLAFGFTFPTLSARPLAWICLAPLFVVLRRCRTRVALLLTFIWAQVECFIAADALPDAVTTYFLQPRWVGLIFAVFIFTVTAALYYMAFASVYRILASRFRLGLPLLAAAAWVAADLGRGRLWTGTTFFIGNPWGMLGYSQVAWPEFIQLASVTGVYGLTFVLVAVNAGIAEVWLARNLAAAARRRALGGLGLVLGTAAVTIAWGAAELASAPEPGTASGAVRVGIVQGNVDIGSRWRSSDYGRNLDSYLKLTGQLLPERPAVVFWPEAAFTFFLETDQRFRRALARQVEASNFELVAGGPRHDPAQPGRVFNSIFLLDESGRIAGVYDKQYLVPFSEYMPLRTIDLVRRHFERIRVFSFGDSSPPLATRAGPAGVLICNEAMLPEVARARVREGAAFLVNPSNDSYFVARGWAERMFELVLLRAVEQRRWLVRASTTGPSGIVDPWGRVVVRSQPFESTALSGSVVPRWERSIYNRAGDLFAFGCLASAAAALLFAGWRRSAGGWRRSHTRPSRESRTRIP